VFGGKVREGRVPENFLQTILGLLEKAAEGASLHPLAIRNLTQAALKRDATIDDLDDFEDGDLPGWTGEGKPPAGPALRTEEPGLRKVLEDLGQKAPGYRFVPADRVDHHRVASGLSGQVEQPKYGVFACARDVHS
jgi:hypothetical protein